MISNYNIELVIQTVLDGESNISDSEGKDLIIFIGPSQVGKSTLINALLGVEFELQNDDSLRPKNENDIKAQVGDLRNGGISITQLPAVYANDSNLCFMDTQGFFDLREDKEMNIASLILMEMAVKKAKSVRIINLCKCDDFFGGLAFFHKYGEQLNKIITCDSEPIYFLFNRYHVPQMMIRQFYEMDESEKNNTIKERLKESYQNLQNGKNNLMKEIIKNIMKKIIFCCKKDKHSDESIFEEEELQDLTSEINQINEDDKNYLMDIRNNNDIKQAFDIPPGFEEMAEKYKYMSYIENSFTNDYYGYIFPESKQSLDNFIQNISVLPVINKENLAFNCMTTERRIFNQIFDGEIIKEIKYMKKIKFAKKYTEEKIDELINHLNNEIRRNKNILNANDISDDVWSQIHVNDELDQLIREKTTNCKHLDHLSIELEKFKNSPPQPFWEKSWDLQPGILLWRNYVCKYNEEIPFVKVEEYLDENTSVYREISKTSPHFEVEYSSKDNALNIFWANWRHFLKLFSEYKNNKCKGKVVLYTERKYLEPGAIPLMEKEIKEIEERIENLSRNISISSRNIKEQAQIMISDMEHQIEILKNYKTRVGQVEKQWSADTNKKSLYSKYYHIITNLYLNTPNISINEFINLYHTIYSNNIVNEDSPISFLEIDREFQLSFS
ncbi:hypothetical protein M9Y10_010947 [Tritrichomonas musculus]|uniref:G domain-containing protein n=1 Tax=Tritrichomonas musculus TaxID=1915356 RepID=A0ABR2IM50_9EUKA